MNFELKSIGIISEANVICNGLTIVIGKNNSGKTTIGRLIYAMVNASADVSSVSDSFLKVDEANVQDKHIDSLFNRPIKLNIIVNSPKSVNNKLFRKNTVPQAIFSLMETKIFLRFISVPGH